jgi:hypothetical protein
MQPVLPLLPHHEAVVQTLIQEDLVAVLHQPPMYLIGRRRIGAGVADEHPGHKTLRAHDVAVTRIKTSVCAPPVRKEVHSVRRDSSEPPRMFHTRGAAAEQMSALVDGSDPDDGPGDDEDGAAGALLPAR